MNAKQATGCYLLIVALCIVFSCVFYSSDEQGAIKKLKNENYTQIKTHGFSWFKCGKHVQKQTRFTAKSPSGKNASGHVCDNKLLLD